jgi:uncharacterized cupredoxin-like copper-binding protein
MMSLRFLPALTVLALALTGVGAATAAPAAQRTKTVRVTAKEYSFALSRTSVPHGKVKFVIENTGSSDHDFAIAGHVSKTIGPHASTTLVVSLKKGRFPYRCTVDSHEELGMKGVLHVT